MLTKEKAADLIIDNKTGGDQSQTSKYDSRIVYYWIDIARAQIISEEYIKTQNVRDAFLKSYVVNVEKDEARDQRYFTLPANIISVSNRNGGELGVYRVSGTKSNQDAFSIMQTGMNDIFSGLDGEVANKSTVAIEGNKGYFYNLSEAIENVRITIIPSLEAFEDNEAIPVPGDREMDLIVLASQLMDESKATTQDKVNDTNSQQI